MATKAQSSSARQPKPLLAKDRVRQAAREMFYRDGIRAVGVDAIVAHAGVTKPSLYRSFSSKDALAAAYLRDYEAEFWRKFDEACEAHPGDPRAQLRAYLTGLSVRTSSDGYRGCGLTNAAVEYPERNHPARLVAVANKQALRSRLISMAEKMGAPAPEALGDGLLLLLEGAYVSSQLFGRDGPAKHLAETADLLIDASLAHTPSA